MGRMCSPIGSAFKFEKNVEEHSSVKSTSLYTIGNLLLLIAENTRGYHETLISDLR